MQSWEKVPKRRDSNQPDHGDFSYAAGFVLAGGKSSRMGEDKSSLKLDGEMLVARAVRVLRYVCAEVAIIGGPDRRGSIARVVPDLFPGQGPLGGIVTALEQSPYEWNVLLAVDMPFVPVDALRKLLSGAGGSQKIVLAEAEGRIQPLCGVYSRAALPGLRQALEAGRLKVKDAVADVGDVRYVGFERLDWFANLNTPEEFRTAQRSIRI